MDESAINVNITNTNTSASEKEKTGTGIQVSHVRVGLGYNILSSPYIHPEYLITSDDNKIMDIEASEVVNHASIFGKATTVTENSVEEVCRSFNSTFKGTLGGGEGAAFSASVSSEFSQEFTNKEECAYTKVCSYFVKSRQTINISESKYRLRDRFLKDIDGSMDPSALFRKYGTHLIREVYLGGRLDVSYTTQKTTTDTNRSVKNAVETAIASVASSSCTIEEKEKIHNLTEKSNLYINNAGGCSLSCITLADLKDAYKTWCASLDDLKQCDVCGIPSYDSLIPIWNFCTNATRRVELEKKFEELAADVVLPGDTYITDIIVVSNKDRNMAKSQCPPGYTLIDSDLNEGAGGDFIYFCVRRGNLEEAITNITCESLDSAKTQGTVSVTHGGKQASYYRIGNDLNKGAKGKFIYLLYTKNTAYKPIRNIMVYTEKNRDMLPEEWNNTMRYVNTTEMADLNKNAGGRYIYVAYKT